MTLDQTQTQAVESYRSKLSPASGDVLQSASFETSKLLQAALADSRFRSQLMAMVGHDLKQPLQVVSIVLDLLKPYLADPKIQPRLQLAHESIERIAHGLDRLALASTIGMDVPILRTFPVSEVLRRIEPTWHEHAARKGIELRVQYCSAYVTSDIAMLSAVLENLVGNAIKYTSKGTVLVGCRRNGDRVSIQVLDTGAGIRTTQLEAIFEAFHQENPASDGLGLGLSIVRFTAAALDHAVCVKSELGKGSLFSVSVPRGTVV